MNFKMKFKIYYELEVDGKLLKGIESEASWFLLTQTGEVWEYGPMKRPKQAKGYKKLIPLFYTGITNNEGEKIYDQDLVEVPLGNGKTEVGVVRYITIGGAYYQVEIPLLSGHDIHKVFFLDNTFKKVGNYLINPELLQKVNG